MTSLPPRRSAARRLAAVAVATIAVGLVATAAPAVAQTVPSSTTSPTTRPSTTTTTQPSTTTTQPPTTTTRPTTTSQPPATTATTRPPTTAPPTTTALPPTTASTTAVPPATTTTGVQRDFSFLPPQPATAVYIRPIVFPVIGKVSWSDTFLAPRANGRRHEGQDLMGTKMQKEVAAVDGTIVVLRHQASGNSLYIRGDDGWYYAYLHINNDTPGTDDGSNRLEYAFAPGMAEGVRVKKGQFVAYMGDSGDAETVGPHLHFEIRMPNASVWNASAVNPAYSLRAAADPASYPQVGPEAFTPWTSATPLVKQQALDILDRPISTRGLPIWNARLNTGALTADGLIQQFLARPESLDPMGTVSRLWLSLFDEMPNANLITWARRLRAGGSLVTQAQAYLDKPELQPQLRATDEQFVTSALTRVLGRAPTTAELDGVLAWGRAGASRAEMLVVISQSNVAKMTLQKRMLLVMVFEAMLRRGPTPSTKDIWLGRLENAGGYTMLVNTIRTGRAYADRF